jgi:hypothetical protein
MSFILAGLFILAGGFKPIGSTAAIATLAFYTSFLIFFSIIF